MGGDVYTYFCDISDREAVYTTAAKVKSEAGKVSILINNAGIVNGKRFLDCTDENITKTFNINTMSHFWTLKAFLPDMIEANHGHLVSMASMAGLCGVPRLTDYCASKFACIGLEESLRMELDSEGHTGVHSTVVCPFFVKTGMFNGVSAGILGLMEPEYVADQIMMAIMTNQEILILPKIFVFLIGLKGGVWITD
ncbi:epidermal retinol dehydrogenase 2-like isoform X2 [Tachypleus tridentatus]|uniref:epidermal retinol dehydrogenase 2-like isoform X2 n=1 Tax=Tachypleus tridentatus TaxID=6853 RepID=UPI003FD4B061